MKITDVSYKYDCLCLTLDTAVNWYDCVSDVDHIAIEDYYDVVVLPGEFLFEHGNLDCLLFCVIVYK